MISSVAADCFNGEPAELVYCRTYGDPVVSVSEAVNETQESYLSDLRVMQTDVFDGEAVHWEPFQDIDEPIRQQQVLLPCPDHDR